MILSLHLFIESNIASKMIRLASIVALLLCCTQLSAQKGEDPVLFTVDNIPVQLSEFRYIYTKTNGEKADFSKNSLKEYLDLYINFKLKVRKAKDAQLDTIAALQQELAGYRRQLADSYLIDREVTEKLVMEVYERSAQDVDISHIMISVSENASPEDTLKAWNRVMEALEKINQGRAFEDIAVEYSTDQSASKNKGRVGYVTTLFPNGFYQLETAAYSGPEGKVLGPIRTGAGYHLLRVNSRRPARGEIEVAHIMVRNEKYPDLIKAREKVDSLHKLLQTGADFNQIAREYSDDKNTSGKGGYIGFFSIGRYEKVFEDAAFSLEKDGDFSGPVQTSIGWHIIRRIALKRNEPLAQVKTRLQNQIKQDDRFALAKKNMIERIKRENDFSENRKALDGFISDLMSDSSETFLTFKWKAPADASAERLFSFGNGTQVSVRDFADYLEKASRKRQQKARAGVASVAMELYQEFVDENALKFEEKQLEGKYPEFKSLMREYEEGVLLFEITKKEVWDKASADTLGLAKFFEENSQKYRWEERAVVSHYTLAEKAGSKIEEVRNFAAVNPSAAVLGSFNDSTNVVLTAQEKRYEKGRNPAVDQLSWVPGSMSMTSLDKKDKSLSFFKIEQVLPPGPKSLQDARGYVVADYQDFLEKKWMEVLNKTYKVKVNEKVFNSLIKK
jgi:peptidyl-prolyl cis-trans isomerase SurA